MGFAAVIPARFASTRLPGKPLLDIAGKPMVVRVVEAALRSSAESVVVATDDIRIVDTVRAHGYEAMLTRADHPSGTDRIAEVAEAMAWPDSQIVVNVQGDEPLLDPGLIDAVAEILGKDMAAAIATAAHAIGSADEFFNPNVVKVVCDSRGRALYFSRAPIPWHRDGFAVTREVLPSGFIARRHIGVYAYRAGFLRRYGQLAPAPHEQSESLEQLRALWHGYGICVVDTPDVPAPGIDTPEDLARVRRLFDGVGKSG